MKLTVTFGEVGNIVGLGPATSHSVSGQTRSASRPIAGQTVAFAESPQG